jgi:large subunit ribosomal protein L5
MNAMKQIRIEKLTLNFGAGANQDNLKKGMKLLKNLTGIEPIKTISDKRIPSWSVRPGLPVGCKITLRGQKANDLLIRLLKAKENKLLPNHFDDRGNVSFGIHEYIDVPDLTYDTSIGIIGFQVSITLKRPGFRIKERKKLKRKIGRSHLITQKDSIDFFKNTFKISVEEEQ